MLFLATILLAQADDPADAINFGGRLQMDFQFSSDANGGSAQQEIRRARFFAAGDLGEVFWKTQFDLAGGDADLKDAYVGIAVGLGKLKIGHFKEPFGLEELTSSKYDNFIEQALGTSLSAASRNTGVMLSGGLGDSGATFAVGSFYEVDGFGGGNEGSAFTGRVTSTPIHSKGAESVLHLGLAYSLRSHESGISSNFAPEAHLFQDLAEYSSSGDASTDLGLEIAWVQGPLSLQAETMCKKISGDAVNGNLRLTGSYAQASYFLDGVTRRAYKKSSGVFGRVKPASGSAWEAKARLSTLDLSEAAVSGGLADELETLSFGVNHYINDHSKVMLDVVKADDGTTESKIILLRFAINF